MVSFLKKFKLPKPKLFFCLLVAIVLPLCVWEVTTVGGGLSNQTQEDQKILDLEEQNEKEEKAEENNKSQDKGNKMEEDQQKLDLEERGERNEKGEKAEANDTNQDKGNQMEEHKQKSDLEKQQERNETREKAGKNGESVDGGKGNEIKMAKIKENRDIDFMSAVGNSHWNEEPGTPEERFSRRQKFMEEKCQRADVSRQSFKMIKSNKIGIFFKQKTVTCLANKSGSTTWRTHLQRVNHSPSIYQQKDKRWKAFMGQANLPKVISETSRVITVRHPLIRLVSAYRQRYENGKIPMLYVWSRKSSHMKKYFSNYWLPAVISNDLIPADERRQMGIPDKHKFGKMYSTSLLMKVHKRLGGHFVLTFPMFLRHVVYTHQHNIVDNHWKPIDWLCSPCLLHYNFVVKLETMTEDLNYVFRKLDIPSEPSIKKNKERSVESPWTDIGRYRDVPLELKKEILRLYWNDLLLFDYKLPPGFLG
ncbi:carbohydrate sulfotransferase 8-like [Macrobrachium rosenbergii]|uniref:carbohydrate sulfotransferase 8-like n=1 Tax=Macrobrachium rosenbergii TaxID=79674 RepID=UPI0034D56267